MDQIKAGTVVQLKSGGPKMTVVDAPENDHVQCIWFLDGAVQRANFKTVVLKVAKEVDGES